MRRLSALLVAVLLGAVTPITATTPASGAATTGLIAGSVDDRASGAPVAGVCVYAYAAPGQRDASTTGVVYRAITEGDGSYELVVPIANYAVEFDPSCGGTVSSPCALQYYFGQLDLDDANYVQTSAVSPITGIDAHLGVGYSISRPSRGC